MYKESSIDILEDIASSLDFTVEIAEVVNEGDGVHTISMPDMYHAQPGFQVTIGGKKYTITGIQPAKQGPCGPLENDVMTVKGAASNITADSFQMYKPFFFYGTPMAEGAELVQESNANKKTPMFWLRLDDFKEEFFENDNDAKERGLKFRLYPLTQADHEKWVTSESKALAIDPMHRLAEIFIKKIKSMPERFDVDNLQWGVPAVFPKFGVISINRGVEKSLWSDKLAGIEMSVDLTVLKRTNC